MNDVIHIACQCDSRFAPDTGVMLHSLFTNNPGENFDVHFLHEEKLPQADRDGLGEVCAKFGQRFSPMMVPEDLKKHFPFMGRYGGFTAWFRILLPKLLPDVPKVLYLDADLLIVRPLRPLWETELAGKCLAAVTQPLFDWMVPRIQKDLGLPGGKDYFNSGVMLLNLDELRNGYCDKVIAFTAECGRAAMPWADQDPLNAILWRHRIHLHPRWNTMNALFDLPWRYLPWPEADMRAAVAEPAIIHFIGPYKPWHYCLRHPYREHYFAHLEHTRWKGRAIEGGSLRDVVLKPLPVIWQWRIERTVKAVMLAVPRETFLGNWLRKRYHRLTPEVVRARFPAVLSAFAADGRPKFFVQVGSNDGGWGDPIRPFIEQRGWRGILIEPVPHIYRKLVARYGPRQGLIYENVAIADADGDKPFYILRPSDEPGLPPWYEQLGSFSRDNVLKHQVYLADIPERIVSITVPCTTLPGLLDKHGVTQVDLLHVDAEGYDFEILRRFDFVRFRPALLLFEHKHLSAADSAECARMLAGLGYQLRPDLQDTLAVHASLLERDPRVAEAWRSIVGGP